MNEFIVEHDGEERRVTAWDARSAATEYISERERRAAEYPVASGRTTERVRVRKVNGTATWDFEVFGECVPTYGTTLLGGSVDKGTGDP